MKIGVITKREKAHKSGSVMRETIGVLESRGVTVEEIYPEDASSNRIWATAARACICARRLKTLIKSRRL